MATVFVPPSPRTSLTMATRRPLANVPNATNSPRRAELVLKRARPTRVDIPYGQPPPKRQVMENLEYEPRSTTCQATNTDSKLFARRSNNSNPSAFEKKLVAAREKERQPQVKHVRVEKAPADTMDSIRQWQRHYRKAFPQFVFYFDSIPEDVRRRFNRQVIALGAREEKFFSRLVTHVVTSRAIPPESATLTEPESTADANNVDSNVQTVNPSLLERNGETHLHTSLKTETRREVTMDILQRARQMGMKIWALEKLQRMITTINDSDIGAQYEQAARNKAAGGNVANGRGENDLSRVLRQELLNGPSDRDPLTSMEMIIFKGPFVYIHDMNEKTKPVMVREYSRVARRQDGSWPQFRSAPLGKCPFIDEPPSRKEYDRHRLRQLHKEKKAASLKADGSRDAKTKAAVPIQAPESVATEIAHSQPLTKQEERVSPPVQNEIQKPSLDETHERKSSESFIPPHFPRTGPFYAGHEPAASGVQPSNMTSAIRSQMISSTAAAPGAKAGLSKEVHGLKRKVLEKGTGGFAVGSMAAPQRRGDGFATVPMKNNVNPPGKPNISHDEDEAKQSEMAGSKRQREDKDEQRKPERRRDPKPGYCENCRDKFDDFEEHTQTRKHRRFAANSTNWAELDALLAEIQRPLKVDHEYDE
ncbi:Regulatory subunit Dfp1/Him1 central region [Penicillium coprophilum]|uniref:Regulatory subunit Dfp1/Him1 central region n=1 Tax=Penicillium coprophilum TaxID=36646 RepID=UPI0023A560DC|nr:Regulatory subunit Dfp1/Him1 central region [Penicillium coprophilum]KAJ5164430.1 Regulatory subunit Dfp1/Him1 central region [Penicillium coprophilum]